MAGNVVRVVDQNGTVVGSYEYNAFGEPLGAQDPPGGNRFQFQSNWIALKDSGGTLFLSPTRLYDASTGRFVQRDRTSPRRGYSYCRSTGPNNVDPDGLAETPAQPNYVDSLTVRLFVGPEAIGKKSEIKEVHNQWRLGLRKLRAEFGGQVSSAKGKKTVTISGSHQQATPGDISEQLEAGGFAYLLTHGMAKYVLTRKDVLDAIDQYIKDQNNGNLPVTQSGLKQKRRAVLEAKYKYLAEEIKTTRVWSEVFTKETEIELEVKQELQLKGAEMFVEAAEKRIQLPYKPESLTPLLMLGGGGQPMTFAEIIKGTTYKFAANLVIANCYGAGGQPAKEEHGPVTITNVQKWVQPVHMIMGLDALLRDLRQRLTELKGQGYEIIFTDLD